MKRRILSVVLALCLCICSQSVSYAGQGGGDQGTPEGKSTVGTESSGETNTDPPETPEPSEDEPGTDKTVKQPENSGKTETLPTQADEPGMDKTTKQPESSNEPEADVTVKQPEGGETDPVPQEPGTDETAKQPEGSEEPGTDETAEEPENSDEEDTALQEISLLQETAPTERAIYQPGIPDVTYPVPSEVHDAMVALKTQEGYTEGAEWTDYYPYSDKLGLYSWQGGQLDGKKIDAAGCVAFAFTLSDAAFGLLPARMYAPGSFQFEDIKVGDILRMNTDTHTVIVLEVRDSDVVIAEGNNGGKVQWGRGISREKVMADTSHYITRYPEGYVPPSDPEADKSIGSGTLDGGLHWNLTNMGTLTISGNGDMPDFGSAGGQPWNEKGDTIRKVVFGQGVTSIGSRAFENCGVLSVEIPSSVKTIGDSAFHGSQILSVTIPSSVQTIGDSSFLNCKNLSSVKISEGVETIGQNAFQACASLSSISLPASIGEVGAGAFWQCGEMTSATFASGSKQVKIGDNLFMQCYRLASVTLPKNADCIGEGMFQNCLMLTKVEIPQGVAGIEGKAFASCDRLTAIIIPDSVNTIGAGAFSDCPLKDIYFTGTREQWDGISKIGDTATAVSKATVHYNYTPVTSPDPDEDKNHDNDNKDDNTGDNSGDNQGRDEPGNDSGNSSDEDNADTWKPTTPDEVRRYAYVGKEPVRCTLSQENAYPVGVENSVQGPMCIQVFEAVCGDYTIGRTYNIYALSGTTYTTDQKVRITIEIPQAICKKDREYKMVCVTQGGLPVLYDDLDSDPDTITIETNTFYAYALIYK